MAEILVVEDYPPMASLVTRMLRMQGHRVVRELTATGAMRHQCTFERAVLDIDLPDGNGVVLAEELLSLRRVKSVMFFTATTEAKTLFRAAELGPVVGKAEGVNRLLSVIQRLEAASPAHNGTSLVEAVL
jgi:DNA-binding response OmpR family regulator